MTAIEYRDYQLLCDYPACTARFYDGRETPRARLRHWAAKEGWTHVRSNGGRKYDEDYCPEHKPAEAVGEGNG